MQKNHVIKKSDKILFIRRDNIGDLVCTTPAIRAVREKFPDTYIGILVNSYNADIVKNNTDIDKIYIYQKAKHVPEKNKLIVWWNNIKVLYQIRKEKYDVAIGCGSYSPRLARYTFLTGAKHRLGYTKDIGITDSFRAGSRYYTVQLQEPDNSLHEVERTFRLLSPLGIHGTPGTMRVFPAEEEILRVKTLINSSFSKDKSAIIALHISSRKPENRWSVEKFAALAKLIDEKNKNTQILLLWSPGSEKNPFHPGDDESAYQIAGKLKDSVLPYNTNHLKELAAALSFSDIVVCCDGGAMHIASALNKPVVVIWGSSDIDRWKPWGNRHVILQGEDKKAENVSVEEAFSAVNNLLISRGKNVC